MGQWNRWRKDKWSTKQPIIDVWNWPEKKKDKMHDYYSIPLKGTLSIIPEARTIFHSYYSFMVDTIMSYCTQRPSEKR